MSFEMAAALKRFGRPIDLATLHYRGCTKGVYRRRFGARRRE
jgi:hypothetical protein